LSIGGEIKNPQKTVPRAILIGILGVLLVYVMVQLVSQGILGSELPNLKEAPLAEASKIVFGPAGYTLLFIGTAVSMFGMISGEILNNPRVIFRLSRDGVIPFSKLASIHRKFKTPYIAILLYAGLGFTLANIGGFRALAVIAASSMLMVYFAVSISVIGLRRKKEFTNGGFTIPFGYTVPILSAGIILYFLSNLTGLEIKGMLTLIVALTGIYFLGKAYRIWKKNKG
jgi:basic amino acid/polyamine antiporter, APA family